MKVMLVTNKSALTEKYGSDRDAVLNLLVELNNHHKKTDPESTLYCIDDRIDMENIAPPVRDNNKAQTKAAVDAIFDKKNPDCMVLVGAGDIVAFQELKDPTDAGECRAAGHEPGQDRARVCGGAVGRMHPAPRACPEGTAAPGVRREQVVCHLSAQRPVLGYCHIL